MGKTTLARLVYNDAELRGQFNLILWVCVSTRFDVVRIKKDIIQAMNREQILPETLHGLQATLKDQLSQKRFFLVLDDVWNADDKLQWEKLMAPLKFGEKGSKILVTTRMKSVAEMVAKVIENKIEVLNLNGLEVEDYRQLFNRHAFAGSNPELHEDLKIIGGDIAKKLGGCPLAAKVLGGHLNQNKQEYYWDKILKEDIRVNADTSEHGFKAILRLSCQNLPTNLQRCFKFCSIFPEDYAFEKDELIYMWIGLGLLPDKNPRLEDIGREYIDYLLRKSFFDIKESNGSTPCIVMHDLLHDLGRSLSIEECFTIGDGLDSNINFPEMIRHLYISADAKDYSLFTRIAQLKKLRTLIIVFKGGDPDENHVPLLAEILTKLKSLRVLSLTASFSCKLPDVIGSLIHLRHLSIQLFTHDSKLDWFPEAVYELYNLRVLRFLGGSGGDFKETNVEGLTNLLNLRHLDVPTIIKDRIPHIGKLASLQGSINFHIQSIDGYKVTELKNLTGIRELSISQLEKVGCSESEAREVNLFKKENLRSLNLVWSMDPTRAPESDERIADVICPPTRLRELTIKGYNGKRFPLWMKFFSDKTYYLTCISLLGCKNWTDLPDLAYLPLLKTLQIKDVGLVSISKLFKAASSRTEASSSSSSPRTSSSLEILKIKYCQELKSIQPDGFKNMHSLKILIMGDCPNLTISGANAELLPPKLEHLSIGPCENLEIPILNSLLNAHSLKYLSFENCTTITTLPSTDVFATLTVLTSLKIKSCTALESLGGLEAAPSLHSLTIFGCNQLIRVSSSQLQSNGYTNQVGTRNTNSMSMLKFLNIDTESLMSIKPLRKLTTVEEIKIVNALNANPWQDLEVTMRSLKRLYLCNATWVVSLPRFLTSLQSLHICGCDAAFLQQHQNGAWSTIGSVEFCKDQCSYQKLFMSDLEFDRSDLA
ncbi:Disease resistance protein RGA2 [Rhynchospora pubera]|uniref:Disease resistance protein RGA2 n=1 Tax=Rhynchospora pubera TaxID=906938 RepID=A0AAV8DC79_9POAL|nr:Disease resistance protein RGA2 [Rhynchospora pubera]